MTPPTIISTPPMMCMNDDGLMGSRCAANGLR
jgi:hypothetical protein